MFKNMALRTRLISGFLSISVVVLIIGLLGYATVVNMEENTTEIIKLTPLVDAAMEMKLSVARDMQMIMELLMAEDKNDLDEIWDRHEKFAMHFDIFANAILNGAETEEGTIFATNDESLKRIVEKADKFHNEEFLPRMKMIQQIMNNIIVNNDFSKKNDLNLIDSEADEIGEKMLEMIGEIEDVAREDIQSTEANSYQAASASKTQAVIGIIFGVLLAGLLGFFITRSIVTPLQQVSDAAQQIADGDLTVEIDINREDEIGQLAEVFRTMVTNLQKMVREITENASTISSSATEFSAISGQMMGSSESMDEKTSTVASASEEINANMSTLSSAAMQSSQSIDVIASSTEEMTASGREISENTAKAREISTNAVNTVSNALEQVGTLRVTADDIGKVIDVILEIAEQTKLLALNATIEAARAGDAGKGFAVVANEVKELAKQTNEAVEDIQIKVSAIQDSTGATIDQIKGIDGVITNVNEIVSSIATAVEEQSVTTKDIAGNISQAADGIKEMTHNVGEAASVTSEIAKDVSSLSQNSSDVKSGSMQVNEGVAELSQMGENLTALVKTFKLN